MDSIPSNKFNAEMQWLLHSQLTSFCEDLNKQLQDSLNFILKSSRKGVNAEELVSDKMPEIADDGMSNS